MKINLQLGQKLFFTSDTHYNHTNICRGVSNWTDSGNATRDFDTLDKMNAVIINNINNSVGEDDILFHLGDWSFGGFDSIEELRSKIECKNIHLVLGNHDHHIERNKQNIQSLFNSVNKYVELNVSYNKGTQLYGSMDFVLMHYPLASWNNMARGHYHLHGHVHFGPDQKLGPGRMLDVGMDGNNLEPYSLSDIRRLINNQPVKSLFNKDHHEIVENYR